MSRKPNFTRKKKRQVHGATFWDTEYTNPSHLKLSTVESGDLAKFTRWLGRQERPDILAPDSSVLDVGCGNGRNLIYLARTFGMHGVGVDISSAAIAQAKAASHDLKNHYHVGKASDPLPANDNSQALILDMMTSHFLHAKERDALYDELYRVLAPGGYGFIKTFLKDGDQHTARLIAEAPGQEEGSYIHPIMGVAEYVYSEAELTAFLEKRFIVRKVYRSHKHTFRGQARKRRTISVYIEKDY